MISCSTPLIAFGFEEANDSLADFGCLQTGETIKRSIMDNYKAYKGIVTEKLKATLGKIDISFGFSKDSTKTSNTSYLPIQTRVSLGSLHWRTDIIDLKGSNGSLWETISIILLDSL